MRRTRLDARRDDLAAASVRELVSKGAQERRCRAHVKGRAHLSSCVKVVSCAEAGLAANPSRATIAKARASSVEWEVNEVRCIVRRRRRVQSEKREQDTCLQSTARIESPQRIIAKAGAAKQVREPLRKRVLVLVFAVGEESAGPGSGPALAFRSG